MKKKRLWVHPSFSESVKVESARKDKSIIEVTKDLANDLRIKDKKRRASDDFFRW